MYNNELLYIDGKWIITSIKLKSFFQLGFSALCIEPTLDQSESEWITMNCLWGAINVMSIMRSDWINDRASSEEAQKVIFIIDLRTITIIRMPQN